jgi:hypothetical protein
VSDRFECGICGTVVSYMPDHGPPAELPSGWARVGRSGMLICLHDRRQRVARAAEREAERRGRSGSQAKQAGTAAVVALELERTPGASDAEISSRLNLGAAIMVRRAREAIEAHRERETPADRDRRGQDRGDARSPRDAPAEVRIVGHEEAG